MLLDGLGWWRAIGLREDIAEYQLISVGFAGAWLAVGLFFRFTARTAHPLARGHVVAYALPNLAWAATTVMQALGATQLDIIVGGSRFPYYRASMLIGTLTGVLVTLACLVTFHLSTGSSVRRVPNGTRGIMAVAWATVLGAWCIVLLRESWLRAP